MHELLISITNKNNEPGVKRQRKSSTILSLVKKKYDAAAIQCIIDDGHAFGMFRRPGMQQFLTTILPGYRGLLAHIFRKQMASLMLCDRTKKKMTFVGLEPTPPAILSSCPYQLD